MNSSFRAPRLGYTLFPLTLLLLLNLLCSISPVSFASAQSTLPGPNSNFQWAVLDEKTLFVEGGSFLDTSSTPLFAMNTFSTAFFALDLSNPWADTNPAWTSLPNGPAVSSQSMVVSQDKTSLGLFAGDTMHLTVFNLTTGSWTNLEAFMGTANGSFAGTRAVLDPETGNLLYSGQLSLSAETESLVYGAAVWSTLRGPMLQFGGRPRVQGGTGVDWLIELIPSSRYELGKWFNLTTTGTSPGPSVNHCMVSAYNGTKLVVFGGYGATSNSSVGVGTVHLLDLTTMVWAEGKSADPGLGRGNPACAVAGDSFVVWGGDSNNTLASNVPLIYNMRTNEWVHQFDPVPKSSSFGSSHALVTSIFFSFIFICVILVGVLVWREMTIPKQKSTGDGSGSGKDEEEQAGGSQYGSESFERTKASGTDLVASKWNRVTRFLAGRSVAIPSKPGTLSTKTLSWETSLSASTVALSEQQQIPPYGSLGIPKKSSYDAGTTKEAGVL